MGGPLTNLILQNIQPLTQEGNLLCRKMEEVEEGEIPEEDQFQVPSLSRDIPLLQKRASLDLLSRQRKVDLSRRDERDTRAWREDDSVLSAEKTRWEEERGWQRDVSYGSSPSSNTPYPSNLYHFAWAQAVKEGPGKSERLSGITSLARSNSRKPELQYENGMPRRDYGVIHAEDRTGSYVGSRQKKGGDGVLETPDGRSLRWTRGLDGGRELHREAFSVSSSKSRKENLLEKGQGTTVNDKSVREQEDGSAEVKSHSVAAQNKGASVEVNGSSQAPQSFAGAVSGLMEATAEGLEDREEGELEEGEIELADQSSRGSPSSQSEALERLSLDRPDIRDRSVSSRSKGAGRGLDRTDAGYYSRERPSRQFHVDHPKHQYGKDGDYERESSRERWDREKHRQGRELDMDREKVEKERSEKKLTFERKDLLSMATKLVKNTTVKDAQKSFSSVCKRLCKALKLLDELSSTPEATSSDAGSGRLPADVSGLARQAFSGIRSVFTIWNTASGREQERDKELFPRLLDLATGLCTKLFKKETRELEGMRLTVAKAGRGLSCQGTSTAPSGEMEKQSLISEAKEESPGNSTSATTQVENVMSRLSTETESTAETSNSRVANGLADAKQAADAAAIAAAAIAYAQSSAAAARASAHMDTRYNNVGSQVPGVRRDSWSWAAGNPVHNQVPNTGTGGRSVSHSRPILHSAPPSRPISVPMPVYKPWTELDRHESDTSNVWPGQIKVKPPLSGAPHPHSLGILGPLPQAMGPKPQVMGCVPQAMGSPPLNLPSLPRFTSVPYTFHNIEDEWEEMSPPGGSTYLSSSMAASKGSSTEFRPANSWLTRLEQRTGTPYSRHGVLPSSVNSMFGDGRLPSPTPSEEDDGHEGKKGNAAVTTASERHQVVDPIGCQVSRPSQVATLSSTSDGVVAPLQEGLEPRLSAGGSHAWKVPCVTSELLPQTPAFGLAPKNLESEPLVAMSPSSSEPRVPIFPQSDQGPHAVKVKDDLQSRSEAVAGVTRKQEVVEPAAWEVTNPKRRKLEHPGQGVPGVAVTGGWLEDGSVAEVPPEIGPIDMEVDEEADVVAGFKADDGTVVPDSGPEATTGEIVVDRPVIRPSADMRVEGTSLVDTHSFGEAPVQQELSLSRSQTIISVDGGADVQGTNGGSPGIRSADSSSAAEVETPAVEASVVKSVHGQVEKMLKPSLASRKNRASSVWGAAQSHLELEHLLEGLDDAERFAVQQERERRMGEQERMLCAKKLCLVLDLDHTLLNSAKFTEIEPEWEHRLRATEAAERSRAGHGRRELYRFAHMGMWTKLRPGIWKFLARASELYELHVYTMGNRVYATEMAKLLDPTGELFAGRVISKGDDAEVVDGDDKPPKSKDLDGVMGMESAVVIIDDSVRVWPHHSQNLIVVERYMYFPSSRRQFGLSGPSLLEVGHDERESDGMLASALGVVDKIHTVFFSHEALQDVDVRNILAAQQRKVLGGCRIVFSRVFPVGELQPQCHPLWRMAEQFGAVCTVQTDDEVTHVVAISLGTDKVNWALATGRYVVRPAWIEASAILYRRANEKDFLLLAQ